jgi:hypothetical protein
MFHLTPVLQASHQTAIFTPQEENQLENLGASQATEGKQLLPEVREMRDILAQLYQGSHWGHQAMCDAVLRVYICPGIYPNKTGYRRLLNLQKGQQTGPEKPTLSGENSRLKTNPKYPNRLHQAALSGPFKIFTSCGRSPN